MFNAQKLAIIEHDRLLPISDGSICTAYIDVTAIIPVSYHVVRF